MLVKNTFTHDARVLREAQTLARQGHQVQVVALLAPGLSEHETLEPKLDVVRVSRGPGNQLRSISDPTRVRTHNSSLHSNLRRQAVRLVRIAARTRAAKYVQRGIDERMFAAAARFQPQIIHAHDLNTLRVGVQVKNQFGCPLIYDTHEIASDRNHHTAKQKREELKLEGELIKSADDVITVSNGCAQFTADLYKISLPHVIMNTPDFDPTNLIPKHLRKELSIPATDTLLVHQGSLQRNRGIEETILAVSEIPDCTYVIIGYGQHRPYLEDFVTKNNLDHKVKFFGPVPAGELIAWTASADIGICTIVGITKSYLYSMPNKLFEYTMAGLPVVASNYPDMGTYVSENEMGLTCDPTSPLAIRAAINELIANPELRNKYAAGARRARQRYNWSTEKQKLLSIYDKYTVA